MNVRWARASLEVVRFYRLHLLSENRHIREVRVPPNVERLDSKVCRNRRGKHWECLVQSPFADAHRHDLVGHDREADELQGLTPRTSQVCG